MEHPILMRIRRESFVPLAWFAPKDMGDIRFVILVGNVGPDMFLRFARSGVETLDGWTRQVVGPMAEDLDAEVAYPFDLPALPFLTWARRGKAGHTSPLGFNIHPTYGLWHAYRAALLFPVEFDLPPLSAGVHPCEACAKKPCLTACPVEAFDGSTYNVEVCGNHLKSVVGSTCFESGCLARRACPVGQAFQYSKPQAQFHMRAFRALR